MISEVQKRQPYSVHVKNSTDARSPYREIFHPRPILSQRGCCGPNSEILIKNTGINPTRAGILKVCEDMGADITLLNERIESGEKIADILVRTSRLHGTTVEGDIIPTLIDEIPVIAVMAAMAEGTTIIRDAAELKVKETDNRDCHRQS